MIKNIIFDFGDVFINLDKPATQRELKKYQIQEFSEEMLHWNKQYEKGAFSSEDFIENYQNAFPNLKKTDFQESWNAVLQDFPKHRLEFIQKLAASNKYRLILLSNTNAIHIDWVKDNIPFFEAFKSCFDAFYLSQEIQMRKPETSIYQFVLKQQQLLPQETLFIDDLKINTDAAEKLGIYIWNINPQTEDVTDLFRVKKELFQ